MKSVFYRLYWGIWGILNQMYHLLFGEKNAIMQFKDKYKDQSCFIIGNGPSLKASDLDILNDKNIISFASNRIHTIYKSTDWRPTFITISDESVITDVSVLEEIENAHPKMFFTKSQFSFYVKKYKFPKCIIPAKCSRKYLNSPYFAKNLEQGIYDIATVTFFSLQIAAYMGFKKIYLIGMDNRYAYTKLRDGRIVRNEGVFDHHNDPTLPDPKSAVSTWELEVAYECAKKYSEENGIRIFNATRGGYLESFERIDFEEIFCN